MLITLFLIIYTALNLFIAYEIHTWLKSFSHHFQRKDVKAVLIIIYTFLGLMTVIAFVLPSGTYIKKLMSRMANYYEGILINTLLTILIAFIIGFILKLTKAVGKDFFKEKKNKRICGTICAIIIVIWSAYGFINAHYIRTSEYSITVDKPGDNMKIVLAADLHLGYSIGYRETEQMAEKINAQNPDLVCIAGDIFDNDYDALDNPERIKAALKSIKSTYGVYACWGNHDISDKLLGGFTVNPGGIKKHDERMTKLLEDAGVKLLADELEEVDGKFTVIGRLDYHKPGTDSSKRKAIDEFDFDKTKPVILIDHEPKELQEIADAGVDIDLCGHTHNGQIFPGTLTINLFWENAAGYLKKPGRDGNEMHNFVTEGVGVYGPFMRTGCKAEIMSINAEFTK